MLGHVRIIPDLLSQRVNFRSWERLAVSSMDYKNAVIVAAMPSPIFINRVSFNIKFSLVRRDD